MDVRTRWKFGLGISFTSTFVPYRNRTGPDRTGHFSCPMLPKIYFGKQRAQPVPTFPPNTHYQDAPSFIFADVNTHRLPAIKNQTRTNNQPSGHTAPPFHARQDGIHPPLLMDVKIIFHSHNQAHPIRALRKPETETPYTSQTPPMYVSSMPNRRRDIKRNRLPHESRTRERLCKSQSRPPDGNPPFPRARDA